MTKINQNSFQVCFEWRNDWGGLKGTAEPRPSQIIRALASQGWSGHQRTPRCITNLELYASAGSFQLARPRKVKIHDQGMSMVNEPGVSSYQPMANLERAKKLVARYQRFCTWRLEGRHQWKFVRDNYYADNSIEREERSTLTGEIRTRMTLGPGGDVCF